MNKSIVLLIFIVFSLRKNEAREINFKPGIIQDVRLNIPDNIQGSYNILGVKPFGENEEQYNAIDGVRSLKEVWMEDLKQPSYEEVTVKEEDEGYSKKNKTFVVLVQFTKDVILI